MIYLTIFLIKSIILLPVFLAQIIILTVKVLVLGTLALVQFLVWIVVAVDWTLRKISVNYCHWRKTHKFPSERDPAGSHVL